MRVAVSILGTEVLAFEVSLGGTQAEPAEVEYGVPFGFSGSGGGHIERSDQDEED
ncbi:hypothetical protein [Actinocorallia longicatena]|uniref:Uncharacterized protein n=1 Tax=Actinocorallia longicatena TaxID=111803 RepID=A0ABP6QHW6_9ACTN